MDASRSEFPLLLSLQTPYLKVLETLRQALRDAQIAIFIEIRLIVMKLDCCYYAIKSYIPVREVL